MKRCRTCHFQPCRCEDLASGEAPGGTQTTGWPKKSLALAVHPEQVAVANARAKRHGIAAHYEADGTCVLADRAARKKMLRLEGFHDNLGGYGD